MKMKIKAITNKDNFKQLSKEEMTEEYFNLLDQVTGIQTDKKPDKNSGNSSKPPSTDLSRKHKTLSSKSKIGPPMGHKGVSRKIKTTPDRILFVPITHDPKTGEKVSSKSKSYQSHQIIEIEPIKIIVIEIRRQTTTINGRTVIAPNPNGINDYSRIGPNFKSHVAELRFDLNVAWGRIQRWFRETANDTIGSGTLSSIFKELKSASKGEYQEIREDIRKGKIVGGDETGFHVGGKKWWIHVFRTEDTTLFEADPTRSHNIATEVLGKYFEGWLMSDFFGIYNEKFYGKNTKFAKCCSHLLRHLRYAEQCEKSKGEYAKLLKNVILDAIYLKTYVVFNCPEYIQQRVEIEQRLDELLSDNVDTLTDEGRKAKKLLTRYRDQIFPFLYIEEMPADNNGSERDIREMVMARKTSNAYRTGEGLIILAQIKSIIATRRKRRLGVFEHFRDLFGKFDFVVQ